MNLEAVAHAQGHRTSIDAAQVAPQAVAVAEAVGHQSLSIGGKESLEAAPAGLAAEVGAERIASTCPTGERG